MRFCLAILLSCGMFLANARATIIVAKDGTGNFTTVQQAFNSIPSGNNTQVTVVVRKGVYRERIELPAGKNFVKLVGEDPLTTVITFDNHTGTILRAGDTVNTYTSATFFIRADDFSAENITFENNAGFNAGQAVAVFAYGDRLAFRNCRFTGFQDVLFCSGDQSRQYYRDCYIEGTTDFIFGPATVVFQHCEIRSKKNSHVTAASTAADKPFGFVFLDCKLIADTSLHNVSLGRPWRPYASVIYLRCWLGAHIAPDGWNNWKNPANEQTARFAEYLSTGPGAQPARRVAWAKQLTVDQANFYTLQHIFPGWTPPFQ